MGLIEALLLEPARINVWIAIRTDGGIGGGTQSDPYDGSTAAKFDAVMNSLPANTCVHLGPGEFKTRGYFDGITGTFWQAKTGMRIVGSGMDVTLLKTDAASDNQRFYTIGHALSATTVDYFEVSDLTIDCNLAGLSGSTATAGAVRIMGNHSRVVRVKIVNWGNKNSGTAGFVVAMLTGDPSLGVHGVTNCGIESCIVTSPAGTAAGNLTVLHVGGKETASSSEEAFGVGPYIRNNFVDSGQVSDFQKDIRALSMAWCRGGVVEGNQVHNTRIGGPYHAATGAGDLIVRNNVYRNVRGGPNWNLGTQGINRLLIEGNTIELASQAANTDYAVILGSTQTPPPYRNGSVVVRNNRIRNLDGGSGNGNGIRVVNTQNLLVRENVVDVSPSNPLSNQNCVSVQYFENRTSSGSLILGFNSGTSSSYDELQTLVDDALLLGFFKRTS